MKDGIYQFDRSKLGQAHTECLKKFVNLVNPGFFNVAVDNTNTTIAELGPFCALALAFSHTLEIITIRIDPYVAASRNTHGVDLKTCQTMATRLEQQSHLIPKYWPRQIIDAEVTSNFLEGKCPC